MYQKCIFHLNSIADIMEIVDLSLNLKDFELTMNMQFNAHRRAVITFFLRLLY